MGGVAVDSERMFFFKATAKILKRQRYRERCYRASAYFKSIARGCDSIRKTMFNLLLFSVLWCLVEVHSQTFPYVSFMGQTLANHSYVDLSLVGDDVSGSDSVHCHTNLSTCCSDTQGVHRGDWYSPGSTDRLPFNNEADDIYESRVAQRVDLRRRNSATSPVGIYRCEITTVAVHDDDDRSVRDAPVYMGLYTASGGII